jgi:hypothetical protein
MTKEEFWNWFDNNKASLEKFISAKNSDYKTYEDLSTNIKQYNEFLIPELTINDDNKFVLVISCDGIRQGIPFVEALAKNLKKFDNWEIVKFRQPGPMEFIPVNGLNLKRSSIFLEWEKTPSQNYDITLFVKGYAPNNSSYKTGIFLHLDHTIGEYNVMTRIEEITIKKLGLFQPKKRLKTLDDLKKEIEIT